MNFRKEMFKYKKHKQPQIKLEKGIMNYFQTNCIKDDCISQIAGHCNRLFMNLQVKITNE
jgi:hypothetical protein